MAREFERMEEANLLSAWENDGTFHGQPVTDRMVLDYFRKKSKGVSRDDPLYEHYKNLVTQYEFEIAESEMMLWYARNKGRTRSSNRDAALQVAAFYREWAQKVPRHSEVYRDLMTNAANYANAYRAQVKEETEADKRKRYERQSQALYDQYEKEGVIVSGILTSFMRQGGYLAGAPGTAGEEGDYGEGLDALNINPATGENDIGAMMLLFEAIQEDPDARRRLRSALGGVSGRFDGTLSRQDFVKMLKYRNRGINERIKLARRYGYHSEVPALEAQMTANSRVVAQTRLLDEMDQIAGIRYNLDSTMSDPDATFSEQATKLDKSIQQLMDVRRSVMRTPGQGDSPLLGAINADLQQLTLGEGADASRLTAMQGGGTLSSIGASGDSSGANQSMRQFAEILEALETGEAGLYHGPQRSEAYGAEATRAYEVIPFVSAETTMGQGYVTRGAEMGSYSKWVPAGEGKDAMKQFLQGGTLKRIQVPGYTYAEFVRTAPLFATSSPLDPRTGRTLGEGVKAFGDEMLGEVALDANDEIIAYGVYNDKGKMQWIDASIDPFVKGAYTPVNGKPVTLSPEGEAVIVMAHGGEKSTFILGTEGASKGQEVGYYPGSILDHTIVPGIFTGDYNDPAQRADEGLYSKGSQWASESFAVSEMLADEEKAKGLSQMSEQDITTILMLDPRFKHGDEQYRVEMVASVMKDVGEIRQAQNDVSGYGGYQPALTEDRDLGTTGSWAEVERTAKAAASAQPEAGPSPSPEGYAGTTPPPFYGYGSSGVSFDTTQGRSTSEQPIAYTPLLPGGATATTGEVEASLGFLAARLNGKTKNRIHGKAASIFAPRGNVRAENKSISTPNISVPPTPPPPMFKPFTPQTPQVTPQAPPMFAPGGAAATTRNVQATPLAVQGGATGAGIFGSRIPTGATTGVGGTSSTTRQATVQPRMSVGDIAKNYEQLYGR